MAATVSISAEGREKSKVGTREWIASRPLVVFFAVAYAGAWLALGPLILAQNGLGVLPLRLPAYPFLVLATMAGPALAAVLVAWAREGKSGVKDLFRRYRIGRSSYAWCLVALYGPLLAIAAICVVEGGTGALDALVHRPLVFVSTYSTLVFGALPTGPLGEELGWRGFALPRLQKMFGPLAASLLLGVLWAGWHLPLFFLPDWKGNASPAQIGVAFFAWVIPFTVIMTWVYNSAGGNTLVTTLLHAGENAAVSLIALHLLVTSGDFFLQAKVYGVIAVVLLITTKGRLAISRFRELPPATTSAQRGVRRLLTPGRIAAGLVLALSVGWVAVNIVYDMIHGIHR